MFFRKKSFYKKNKKIIIIVGMVLLLGIVAVRAFNKPNNQQTSKNINQTVNLINLNEYRQNQAVVKGTGEVEAIAQVELKSEVSAAVSSVLVSIGDNVIPGQPLVYFRNGELAAQYNQAKADLDRALVTKDQLVSQYQATVAAHARAESNAASSVTAAQAAYDLAANNLKLNSDESSSQIIEDAYDDVIPSIKSLHNTLRSSMLSADTVLGIDSKSANDDFEGEISLNDISALNIAETQYIKTGVKMDAIYNTILNISTASSPEEIDNAVAGLGEALDAMNLLWGNLGDVLINSIGLESGLFEDLQSVVEGGQSTMSSASASYINLKQDLSNAKSSLTGVEIAYDKAVKDLEEAKVRAEADVAASLSQLNQAESAISAQDAAIDRARAVLNGIGASLAKTTIKSPIAGTVAVLPAKTGELMTPGALVASIVNTNGLQIRAYVDSNDISRVSVNAPAKISGSVEGVITNVAPSIDPKTKKVEVLVAVSEPELSKLIVGQFVDIEIEEAQGEDTEDIIRLPLKSIDVTDSGSFVYVLGEDNMVEKREVRLNRIIGTYVEVVSGLDNIQEIIASVRGIKVGEKVNVRN